MKPRKRQTLKRQTKRRLESKIGNKEGSENVIECREGSGGDENSEVGQRGETVKPKKRLTFKRQT